MAVRRRSKSRGSGLSIEPVDCTPILSATCGQLERSGFWQGKLQTFAEDASIFTVLKHLPY